MNKPNYAHYRTGSVAMTRASYQDSSGRVMPYVMSVLHAGPKVMLDTELELRLNASATDPHRRVCVERVCVGEVYGTTWEEAFLTTADRLRRAAESLEAAARGPHLSLPVASLILNEVPSE